MSIWILLVDLLRALLFAVAHVAGGTGASILIVSTAIRVALLPVTLRMARLAREHQDAVRRLEPEIARIRRRYAGDPARILEETAALYKKTGVGVMPRGALASMLIQAPIYGAFYQAITTSARKLGGFLWIRDLAAPDLGVAVVASLLAAVAAKIDATTGGSSRASVVAAAITLLFAWRLSAGAALYWVASNTVGAGQALILRREAGISRTPAK